MATKLFQNVQNNEIMKIAEQLPKKEKTSFTASEIVKLNLKCIKLCVNKGYSFPEIAKLIFEPNGCNISGASLKREYDKIQIHSSNIKKSNKITTPIASNKESV